jgi:epoxide hydrolase-like predicted phosphatase
MNKSIKAILFDVGGVLVRTFDHSGRREWEKRLGLAPGELEAIVLNSDMGHRAQRGEISDAELWQWAGAQLGIEDQGDAFRRDFWRGDAVDQSLVQLIRELRGRYRMAVISNATDELEKTLEKYGLLSEFDLIVGSAYEGIMKPNPAIYLKALDKLGCEPGETVFIDDAPRNISAAKALGIRAILFSPSLDLRKALAELGVYL